ncbi:MAG: hypothetical protein COA96_17795 [SAR86 cluster bacterium]|uniref:Lipocalin-like domain-containing protein n=1 Tax=SAR86 cluster bacterium TaxID=2030880 RepID=A0A2A5ADS5_9GAMM|nr:MAG: hypothetical protein COA96_17795 [SAR86 cluster bacterium]
MKNTLLTTLTILSLLSFSDTYAAAEDTSIIGSWEGSLMLNSDDSTNLTISFSGSEGQYSATLTSPDMGIYGMPADYVRVRGVSVTIRIQRLNLEILGTLRKDDGSDVILRIDGQWFQRSEMVPVVLLKASEPAI